MKSTANTINATILILLTTIWIVCKYLSCGKCHSICDYCLLFIVFGLAIVVHNKTEGIKRSLSLFFLLFSGNNLLEGMLFDVHSLNLTDYLILPIISIYSLWHFLKSYKSSSIR